MNNNRIYAVDFIRSCSMLLIITYHVFTRMDWYKPDITHPFTNFVNGNWGYIGVACFLAISGFVLSYNYSNLTIQSGKRVLINFYKKRWSGLFPAFYIVWLISYIVNIIKYNKLWWGGGTDKDYYKPIRI